MLGRGGEPLLEPKYAELKLDAQRAKLSELGGSPQGFALSARGFGPADEHKATFLLAPPNLAERTQAMLGRGGEPLLEPKCAELKLDAESAKLFELGAASPAGFALSARGFSPADEHKATFLLAPPNLAEVARGILGGGSGGG